MISCRALLAGLVFVALLPWGGDAQSRRGPLAAIRILGGPVITIDERGGDTAALAAAGRVLEAAGVRYVLEGPAPDPDAPLYDIAAPPGAPVILTGLTLGDALDRIAVESPRFIWAETDNVIVARFTAPGTGLLDARLQRFSVSKANARTVMGALIAALAPSWDQAARISIWPRPTPNPRSPTPPPALSTAVVSLSRQNTTVADVLTRLARESESWSFNIQHERAPASIDTAQLRLLAGRDIVVASAAGGQDPRRPPTTATIGFDINNQLWPVLAAYADSAGLSVGFEQARGHQATGPAGPRTATLYLTGLTPASAIARIVAYDSRYAWEERGGRFVVFPKSGSSSILSRALPSFVRVNEPILDVVGDLLGRLGAETIRDGQPLALRPGTSGSPEAARQLVTVELREPTTLRAAIERLCAAVGCSSWAFRAGGPAMGRAGYDLEMHGPNGLSIRRTATVLEPAPTLAPPEFMLPADLDRDLPRVYSVGSGALSPYFAMAGAAKVPIGLELRAPRRYESDPRYSRRSGVPQWSPAMVPGKLSEQLYLLLEREPEYRLRVRTGVINIAPASAWSASDHFLDRPLGRFTVDAMPVWQIGVQLRQRLNPGGPIGAPASLEPPDFGAGRANNWSKTVTFSLENPTARDVLNTLAIQHGNLGWMIRYQAPRDTDAAMSEAHAVLVLAVLSDVTFPGLQYGRDGSMTFAPPPARPGPAGPAQIRGVERRQGPPPVLQLPAQSRVDVELDRMCRNLAVKCTTELVSTRLPVLTDPDALEGTYDFSGMTPAEAFDKVSELVPGITWNLDGDLYRLRSTGLDRYGELPIDRRIAVFEHDLPSTAAVRDAVQWLLRDPEGAPPGTLSRQSTAGRAGGPPPARPAAVRLQNATIREILDAIVRANPDYSWGVRYLDAHGTIPQLDFRLSDRGSSTASTIPLRGR